MVGRPADIDGIHQHLGTHAGEQRATGPQVVVLEVQGGQPEIVSRQGMAIPEPVHEVALGDPVDLADQAGRIPLQTGEDLFPALHDLLGDRAPDRLRAPVQQVLLGGFQQLPLEVHGSRGPAVREDQRFRQGEVPRHGLQGPDRIGHRHRRVQHVVLHHPEDDGGGPQLEERGHLAEVGVSHDDVQPPVPEGIGVGLVAGVDYGPLQGRLQANLLLEEVGTLRELKLDVAPIPVG